MCIDDARKHVFARTVVNGFGATGERFAHGGNFSVFNGDIHDAVSIVKRVHHVAAFKQYVPHNLSLQAVLK